MPSKSSLVLQEEQPPNNKEQTSWVKDMTIFVREGKYPQGLDRTKRRHFKLESIPYILMDDILFRKDSNGVLLRCINENEVSGLLEELHDGPSGGHFSTRTIVIKIMRVGYYWTTLFGDALKWVIGYKKCALFLGK